MGTQAAGNVPAGFWDFSLHVVLPQLLAGARLTVYLTICALALGTVLATLAALGRISTNPWLRGIAQTYVTVVRGTPAVLQVIIVYDVLPLVHILVPAFGAGVIALSVNAGAYIAEIIRAGIQSIDKGQMEAARSLGMSYNQAMWRIIIPQTFRRLTPPMVNEAVALLKDSSLVGVVALSELYKSGRIIWSRTFRWESYFWVAVLYLIMTTALTLWSNRLEKKLEARE